MVSVTSATTTGVYANQLNKTDRETTKSLNQISTGKSINKASDNAAGLAIATKLSSDVTTLRQSGTNLLQGSALLQTADSSLEETGNILNRMKELSTQAQSGSVDDQSRSVINEEYQNLKSELDKNSNSTNFNGQKLVDGSYNNNFQSGTSGNNVLNVDLTAVDSSAAGLGLTAGAGASATALSTPASAQAATNELDAAIEKVSSYRAQVGSLQSALATQSDVVDSNIENEVSAKSAIEDADISKAISDFTSSKLLNDVALAAAAQGNKADKAVLKLVR